MLMEHTFTEVYSYVRSPFRDLFVYDTVVQVRIIVGLMAAIINAWTV